MEKTFKKSDGLALLAVGALACAAVTKELRTPAKNRTWHGSVIGVPYDFRPPTLDRLRQSWWDPDDERVVTAQPFGLGWTLNVGRLVELVRTKLD